MNNDGGDDVEKLTKLLGCCDADGRGVPDDKMNARRPSQQPSLSHSLSFNAVFGRNLHKNF